MTRALVLNATYEPIGVVSARRAVVLALDEKVDVLADTGEHMGSATLSFPVPSVIRLRYFVKVPTSAPHRSAGGPCSHATTTAASTAAGRPRASTM